MSTLEQIAADELLGRLTHGQAEQARALHRRRLAELDSLTAGLPEAAAALARKVAHALDVQAQLANRSGGGR